jgi:hypothetical protein
MPQNTIRSNNEKESFFGVKGSFLTVTQITSEKCEPKVKAPILGIRKEAVAERRQLK